LSQFELNLKKEKKKNGGKSMAANHPLKKNLLLKTDLKDKKKLVSPVWSYL
jgi:hypothetical protein